jgi:hypothetical protein
MIPFTRFAFFTVARDASFVSLTAGMLMLAFSFQPPMAFEVGATVALVFSIALVVRAHCLTEERIERCEVWKALKHEHRPEGEGGRRLARAEMTDVLLRFAKSAAGVAGILYGSALVMSVA